MKNNRLLLIIGSGFGAIIAVALVAIYLLGARGGGQTAGVFAYGCLWQIDFPDVRWTREIGYSGVNQPQFKFDRKGIGEPGYCPDGFTSEQSSELVFVDAHAEMLAFDLQFHEGLHTSGCQRSEPMRGFEQGSRLTICTRVPAGQSPASSGKTTQTSAPANGRMRNGCCCFEIMTCSWPSIA